MKPYQNANVKVYPTESNIIFNVILVAFRSALLIIKYPNRFKILVEEIRLAKTSNLKWIFYQRFLPILLYKPDIMHFQWTKSLWQLGFLKQRLGVKLVVSLLGTQVNYTPIVSKRISNSYKTWFPVVDGFLAVSDAIKKEALKYNASLDKIRVIRSPIPNFFFEAFKPYKKRIKPKSIKLISIGRFHWIKGIKYALRAIKILKEKGYNVEYTIIGRLHVPIDIQYAIQDMGLKEEVKILGSISQVAIIEQFHQHDLLILPSIMEGVANVVLEAMAVGLPVISTDCGGMPEVVLPNETGWLVPTRNPEAIADEVVVFLNSKTSKIEKIVQNAHNYVKRYYNAEQSINEVLIIYKALLK